MEWISEPLADTPSSSNHSDFNQIFNESLKWAAQSKLKKIDYRQTKSSFKVNDNNKKIKLSSLFSLWQEK